MKRFHSMPFGAEITDTAVRFRLWAPTAEQVDLCLAGPDGDERISLSTTVDSWFEITTHRAAPGTRYRYRINDMLDVPDPVSRFNPDDVHSYSEVIDPASYQWQDEGWKGKPWETAVIYELHVGTFTREGTFEAAIRRLDYLVELGITAIELMPVADFPGRRDWGYDGVLLFAPDSSYGRPDDLKRLVDAAHRKGLMVFLDVVYNHFGPEGNYLHAYAPQFFTERHHTPWGAAVNFDGPGNRTVRDFYIHNALYWLEEFHFDGLRFDAVHAIIDDSARHILMELSEAVHAGPGRERIIHLILENDRNAAHYLARDENGGPRWYTAQWNDDIHHAMHVIASNETDGYYMDYADHSIVHLVRCLTQGFAYQGERSHFRAGECRGEHSAHLPPAAFVAFMQNHDQIGNRAFGERLSMLADSNALRALTAILLLAPSPPLLFMGEEFAADTPFLFFCDFGADLANAVREGRRKEFAGFARFSDPAEREAIPDPGDVNTFERSKLDWDCIRKEAHASWLSFYRHLLRLRREFIVPQLSGMQGGQGQAAVIGNRGLSIRWPVSAGAVLTLTANLSGEWLKGVEHPVGACIYQTNGAPSSDNAMDGMPPWYVAWNLLNS